MKIRIQSVAKYFCIATLLFFSSITNAGVVYESIKLKSGEVLIRPEFSRRSESGAVFVFKNPKGIRTIAWDQLPDSIRAELDVDPEAVIAEYKAALKLCKSSRFEWENPAKPTEGRAWALSMAMEDESSVMLSFCYYFKPYESLYYVDLKGDEISKFSPIIAKFFQWDKQAVETNVQTMQRTMATWRGRDLVFTREHGRSSISGDHVWLDVESATRLCNMCGKHIKDMQAELEKKLNDIKRSSLDFR